MDRSEHATEEMLGAIAFQEAVACKQNPYGLDDPRYDAWEAGWDQAMREYENLREIYASLLPFEDDGHPD